MGICHESNSNLKSQEHLRLPPSIRLERHFQAQELAPGQMLEQGLEDAGGFLQSIHRENDLLSVEHGLLEIRAKPHMTERIKAHSLQLEPSKRKWGKCPLISCLQLHLSLIPKWDSHSVPRNSHVRLIDGTSPPVPSSKTTSPCRNSPGRPC